MLVTVSVPVILEGRHELRGQLVAAGATCVLHTYVDCGQFLQLVTPKCWSTAYKQEVSVAFMTAGSKQPACCCFTTTWTGSLACYYYCCRTCACQWQLTVHYSRDVYMTPSPWCRLHSAAHQGVPGSAPSPAAAAGRIPTPCSNAGTVTVTANGSAIS